MNLQEKYLLKLKSKNIKVLPLEKYTNSTTKIIHKCECGNEWNTNPHRVLSGSKCGCLKFKQKNKSNDYYIKKLQSKNIKVLPLEKYNGSHTKILHKCICNKEWMITPVNVLQGKFCGCKPNNNFRNYTFYKNKKTILYYIKININNQSIYKVGVTLYKKSINNSIRKRFAGDKVNVTLIRYKCYDNGEIAYKLEQKIIKHFSKFKYLGEKILRGGNSELFSNNLLLV